MVLPRPNSGSSSHPRLRVVVLQSRRERRFFDTDGIGERFDAGSLDQFAAFDVAPDTHGEGLNPAKPVGPEKTAVADEVKRTVRRVVSVAQHGKDELVIGQGFVDKTPSRRIDRDDARAWPGRSRYAGKRPGCRPRAETATPAPNRPGSPRAVLMLGAGCHRDMQAVAGPCGSRGGNRARSAGKELFAKLHRERSHRSPARRPCARRSAVLPDESTIAHASDGIAFDQQLLDARAEQDVDVSRKQRRVEPRRQRVAQMQRRSPRRAKPLQRILRNQTQRAQGRAKRAADFAQVRDVEPVDHHAAEHGEFRQRRTQPPEVRAEFAPSKLTGSSTRPPAVDPGFSG